MAPLKVGPIFQSVASGDCARRRVYHQRCDLSMLGQTQGRLESRARTKKADRNVAIMYRETRTTYDAKSSVERDVLFGGLMTRVRRALPGSGGSTSG